VRVCERGRERDLLYGFAELDGMRRVELEEIVSGIAICVCVCACV